jgi:Flp pilus assembly protein TadG
MRARLNKLRSSEAAEIAEAALVLPVVFIFVLGIIWFGRAFNIYSTIQQAAQQGAITAARSTCVTCGDVKVSDSNVATAISAVLQASNLNDPIPTNSNPPTPLSCIDPSVTLTCPPPTNNITICRQALLNSPASASQTPQCGTIVSFQYQAPFSVPFTSLTAGSVKLNANAQSRMEN